MFRSTLTFVLAAAVTIPAALSAQDTAAAKYKALLGEWEMTLETPRGTVTQQLVFTRHGDEPIGTTSSQRGESELTNLSFKDGQLSFDVVRNFGERTMTQRFKATIEGNEMTGTISGGRGGERPFNAKRKAT